MTAPTTTQAEVYAERVARGAAYLDGVRPGWRAEINKDTLNMADALDCIGGQLYGVYWDIPALVELEKGDTVAGCEKGRTWAVEHGFTLAADDIISSGGGLAPGRVPVWQILRAAWIAQIDQGD